IRIVPAFDPAGVTVWLPVEPALAFEQTPAPIQGLGVETATLVIGTRGSSIRDSVMVAVSSNRGGLESNRVAVKGGGSTVTLRSAGVGPATIRASATGFQPAEIEVEFKWPILFLVSAVAGAAFGGLVGAIQARKKEPVTSTVGHALPGLLVG